MRAEIEAYAAGRKAIVIDFRRVYDVETSGVRELIGLAASLERRGILLAFSHIGSEVAAGLAPNALRAASTTRPLLFADMDAALEWAEEQVLALDGGRILLSAEIPVGRAELFAELTAAELAQLLSMLLREDLPTGHTLFKEGDPGDRMFVITRGEVSITLALAETARRKRLASFGPGMAFGEMSLLEGKPRSATAEVTSDATIYSFDADAFARLQRTHAAIALKIVSNLARQIAARLRIASEQLRSGC